MPAHCLESPWTAAALRLAHRSRVWWREGRGEWAGRLAAWIILILCSPVLLAAWVCGARVRSRAVRGRGGKPVRERRLVGPGGAVVPVLGDLMRLWSVGTGELAWVGPEPRTLDGVDLRREPERRLTSVRPGLVCTWWVRCRTNVAYGTQTEADLEYLESRSAGANAGILARAVAALCYGAAGDPHTEQAQILGFPIDNLSLDEAVDQIVQPRRNPLQVSFLNVDCINKAVRSRSYREVLTSSGLRLADGIGLRIAGRILKSEIRQNVNGTDMFPRLCERMEGDGLSLYLLGARPGVAEAVRDWACARFPRLRIAGVHHGYWSPEEEPSVVHAVRNSGADVALVAMGAPAQEDFIRRYLKDLGVRAALGVGGLFDFYSGRIPRAPQYLREIGLEWVYRLYQEPGRMWRRYLIGNVVFLTRVLIALRKRQSPIPC